MCLQDILELRLPRGTAFRRDELPKQALEGEIEQLVLRLEVGVERHRGHTQVVGEGPDGQRLQTRRVDDRKGGIHDIVAAKAG